VSENYSDSQFNITSSMIGDLQIFLY